MIKKRTNELDQDELEIGGLHSRSDEDAPIEQEIISKEELKKEVLANANQNQADFDWDRYEGGKNLSKSERKEMEELYGNTLQEIKEKEDQIHI